MMCKMERAHLLWSPYVWSRGGVLGIRSARRHVDLCFVSVPLAFEALPDFKLRDVPFDLVVSMFNVYAVFNAFICFFGAFGEDYNRVCGGCWVSVSSS